MVVFVKYVNVCSSNSGRAHSFSRILMCVLMCAKALLNYTHLLHARACLNFENSDRGPPDAPFCGTFENKHYEQYDV